MSEVTMKLVVKLDLIKHGRGKSDHILCTYLMYIYFVRSATKIEKLFLSRRGTLNVYFLSTD